MKQRYIIYLAILCLAFSSPPAKSQPGGMLSQYMFNKILANSACTGNNEALTLNFLHKNQWTGVKGAPSTFVFSGHSPAGEQTGLGLILANDQMGGLTQTGIYGMYAYRIKSPEYKLSFGLQAGFTAYDYCSLLLRDENDPAFVNEDERFTEPNVGTGIYYENDRVYFGFSVPGLFDSDKDRNIAWSLQQKSYIFLAGYAFRLSDALTLNPSTFISIKAHTKAIINLNANLLIDDLIWVGALYRNLDNLGFIGKFQINRQIQVGYGYDPNIGRLASLSSGSHEIMIQYAFKYVEKNAISPKFF